MRLIGSIGLSVSDLNEAFASKQPAMSVFGAWLMWCRREKVGICRGGTADGSRLEPLAVIGPEDPEGGLTEPHSPVEHRLEYWCQVAR